jgi:hypothetical protein
MSTAAPIDILGKVGLTLLFAGALFLIVGTFRGPIAWAMPLGLVFVGLSTAWRPRDKVIAILIGVVMLAMPFIVLFSIEQDLGMGALALVLLWPAGGLIAGAYLLLARRQSRRRVA